MGRHLSQRYGQVILVSGYFCFDSCQLTTTWMWNIRLQASKLARKCTISHWFPCGAGGRAGGHTVTLLAKFLGWVGNQIFLAMGLRYEMTSNRSFFYKEAEGNRKRPIVEHE